MDLGVDPEKLDRPSSKVSRGSRLKPRRADSGLALRRDATGRGLISAGFGVHAQRSALAVGVGDSRLRATKSRGEPPQ